MPQIEPASPIDSNVPCGEPERSAQPVPKRAIKVITRTLSFLALVGLLSFIVIAGVSLWREFNLLQGAIGDARQNQFVGYRDVGANVSLAKIPRDWFRDNGEETQLWSRWEEGVGHRWFRFRKGDIAQSQLARPASNFVSRPIDYPLIENDGGEIWQRIPMEAPVVGVSLGGVKCVYPIRVLDKVQVINDLVQDHAFLIAINQFAPTSEAVSVFDAEQDGHRLTMAATGYFHEGKPLLYDRGTESLWCENGESLKAVAGTHRGTQLPRVVHLSPVTWKSWLGKNHQCRLLVGADRSRGIPDK
jgi:Protein of unknown function (DUF3179)